MTSPAVTTKATAVVSIVVFVSWDSMVYGVALWGSVNVAPTY